MAGLEAEPRNIGPAGQLDPEGPFVLRFGIKLGQLLADLGRLHPYDRIAAGVVADGTAEHLGADHPLAQAVKLAQQGMADDEAKEILSALAAREGVTGKYIVQVPMHQFDLFRAEYLRLPGWIGCQHGALTIPLNHKYTIA